MVDVRNPRRHEYSSDVGVDLIGCAGNGWLISGIVIDNPTGAWLKVSGINDYVPPYTQGWARPVVPAAIAIDVVFTAQGPAGSASDFIGDPIDVTVLDLAVETSNGQAIAPPGLSMTVDGVQLATDAVANTDNTTTVLPSLVGVADDQRYRVWKVVFAANAANHAAHNWLARFGAPTWLADDYIKLSGPYPTAGEIEIPGGVALPLASALQVVYRASIAGPMFYHATAMWTLEAG